MYPLPGGIQLAGCINDDVCINHAKSRSQIRRANKKGGPEAAPLARTAAGFPRGGPNAKRYSRSLAFRLRFENAPIATVTPITRAQPMARGIIIRLRRFGLAWRSSVF
jgi:hypothetical protein